jgi:dihydrofolate reductase
MRLIGFSTGALAKGDYATALGMLRARGVRAVELSALRASELGPLMAAVTGGGLDLRGFNYVSVHAPSKLDGLEERQVAELLAPCAAKGWPIILHPDVIQDAGCWSDFGRLLCLENMDTRKRIGRTAEELQPFFEKLPQASLCFDLGHARQVDPTLVAARAIIGRFGDRIVQLHVSELDEECRHNALGPAVIQAMKELGYLFGMSPIILESTVPAEAISQEIDAVRGALPPAPIVSLVAALDEGRVIGNAGGIPWKLSTDLKRLKTLTMGKPVVMGRKTWESINSRALPGRKNTVITRQAFYDAENAETAPSVKVALQKLMHQSEVMILGGTSVFEEAMPFADRLHLTYVSGRREGDAFFPVFEEEDWVRTSEQQVPAGDKDEVASTYVELRRKER